MECSDLQETINKTVKKLETKKEQPKQEKKDPPCARCKKNKKTTKHHWPLGSRRLVPLCTHCYSVVKRQRNRSKWHFGKGLF